MNLSSLNEPVINTNPHKESFNNTSSLKFSEVVEFYDIVVNSGLLDSWQKHKILKVYNTKLQNTCIDDVIYIGDSKSYRFLFQLVSMSIWYEFQAEEDRKDKYNRAVKQMTEVFAKGVLNDYLGMGCLMPLARMELDKVGDLINPWEKDVTKHEFRKKNRDMLILWPMGYRGYDKKILNTFLSTNVFVNEGELGPVLE